MRGPNDGQGQQKMHTVAQIDPATGQVIPGTQTEWTQEQFRLRDKSQNYVKVDAAGQPLPEEPEDGGDTGTGTDTGGGDVSSDPIGDDPIDPQPIE